MARELELNVRPIFSTPLLVFSIPEAARINSELKSGTQQAGVRVRVRDANGMNARFLVAASQQVTGTGALATAEALDARAFLDAMAYEDEGGSLSWEVL